MPRLLLLILLVLSGSVTMRARQNSMSKTQQQQYASAERVYNRCFPTEESTITRNRRLADSIYNEGLHQHNYRVQILGLQAMVDWQFRATLYEEALNSIRQAQQLALQNQDVVRYFEARNRECTILQMVNPSQSMLMTRELIRDATRRHYELGLAFGYSQLGELNMYYRYEYSEAADNFRRALEICQRHGDEGPDAVRLMTEYASALVELNDFDAARAMLDSIPMYKGGPLDESEHTSIDIIRLDMAYNQGLQGEAYDRIHRQVTRSASFRQLFLQDSQLFYHIRWLIRTGQIQEAFRQIPQLELDVDRLTLSRDAYVAMHDYESAYRLEAPIRAIQDSIQRSLRNQDFAAVDAQIQLIEMTEKSEITRQQQHVTIAISAASLLALALLVTLYLVRRRRHYMVQLEAKNHQLARMNTQLQQANLAKHQFMQNVTHELHTPLNAISGFSTLLTTPGMEFTPQEAAQVYSGIHSNSLHLTTLIDDIIHINEYDDPTFRPALVDCIPAEFVRSAMSRTTLPDDRQLQLTYIDDCPADFVLHTHYVMMELVTRSLLSNAVKFTPQGQVTIRTALSADGQSFHLTVADTGIGIPADHRERIFDRFYQIDSFVPGAGLGLSLCRIIAHRLGGFIRVDDTYTTPGTRMLFVVPVR